MATAVAAPAAAVATSAKKAPKHLPAPNSDFYQLADVLTAEEKMIVKKVRTYMETRVQPIINKYWSDDEIMPISEKITPSHHRDGSKSSRMIYAHACVTRHR